MRDLRDDIWMFVSAATRNKCTGRNLVNADKKLYLVLFFCLDEVGACFCSEEKQIELLKVMQFCNFYVRCSRL